MVTFTRVAPPTCDGLSAVPPLLAPSCGVQDTPNLCYENVLCGAILWRHKCLSCDEYPSNNVMAVTRRLCTIRVERPSSADKGTPEEGTLPSERREQVQARPVVCARDKSSAWVGGVDLLPRHNAS